MNKIFEIVEYITSCVNAVSKGFKVVADNWPVNNPFVNGDTNKKVSNGVEE